MRSPERAASTSSVGCGCLLPLLVLLFNLTIGAVCVTYDLRELFNASAPWWVDVVGGLFLGDIAAPLALVLWILTSAGVHV